ncbi:MAG TPA: hypothetical protein VM686_37815, partial [Polyangiaceae bacterium]|nr:hypothetical protein [Polyangiaceae bacterium]
NPTKDELDRIFNEAEDGDAGNLALFNAGRREVTRFVLDCLTDFEKMAKAGNSSQQSGANAVIAGLRTAMRKLNP